MYLAHIIGIKCIDPSKTDEVDVKLNIKKYCNFLDQTFSVSVKYCDQQPLN